MGGTLLGALAIVNGLVGDRLAREKNELATTMGFVHDGRSLAVADAVGSDVGRGPLRVVVLVHGLMCTESFWEDAEGTTFGHRLEADLGLVPLFVRYNTGRPIHESGRELANLLEALVTMHAIDEIVLLGHSMGGLVARSACRHGTAEAHRWRTRVRRAIYIGSPHLGAPAERAGRVVTRILRLVDEPITALVADVAELRSGGVKDLGDAHDAPLADDIAHFFVAGTVGRSPLAARLFGDAMVPVASATAGVEGGHERVIVPATGHVALASSPAVYAHVHRFCGRAS